MSPFDFELSQQSKPVNNPRIVSPPFSSSRLTTSAISRSSGIFPTYPALISRAEQTGTANNSRQSRVSHRHPRDPLGGGRGRSRTKLHYTPLPFSLPPRSRPSELPNAARTAALTTAQKRPSSPLRREFDPSNVHTPSPSPRRGPFQASTPEKAALSPRVIVICFRNYGLPRGRGWRDLKIVRRSCAFGFV